MALFNANEERIPELINDPRVMVGLSDGGAHVDMLCDAGYCTYLLGTWVREKQAMTLERAIKRITSEPADFFGIKNRGRLLPGMAADVVDLRLQHGRFGQARRDAQRSARRRPAARDAGARHRARGRQRSDALRRRKARRRDAGPGVAFRQLLRCEGQRVWILRRRFRR